MFRRLRERIQSEITFSLRDGSTGQVLRETLWPGDSIELIAGGIHVGNIIYYAKRDVCIEFLPSAFKDPKKLYVMCENSERCPAQWHYFRCPKGKEAA